MWSPLQEATFFNVPASAVNLAIVEINYHPSDPTTAELGASSQFDQDSFEFLEFQNTSNVSIDLAGVELTQGVTFDFDTSSVHSLAPGQRIILVRSVLGFQTRYGTQIPIAGVYSGRLADGGEALTLVDHNGDVIQDFAFDDEGSWPERADGKAACWKPSLGLAIQVTRRIGEPARSITDRRPRQVLRRCTRWSSTKCFRETPPRRRSMRSNSTTPPPRQSISAVGT